MRDNALVAHQERIAVLKSRENKVVKHNDLVQKSRFDLTLTEQKTINFLVSLIKPKKDCTDSEPLEYGFEIMDYCKICGIDYQQGKNYTTVRNTLKSLRDKSVVVTLADGTETSVSWLNKFWSNKRSGWVKIRFDEDIAPYLFEICNNTTRYELLNVLPMKSKYSVRMYEICRSWAGLKSHTYKIEELRKLLDIPDNELSRYPDFRRNVLEISAKEINEHTDLNVYYEPIKKGRKVIQLRVHISEKSMIDKIIAQNKVNEILDGN